MGGEPGDPVCLGPWAVKRQEVDGGGSSSWPEVGLSVVWRGRGGGGLGTGRDRDCGGRLCQEFFARRASDWSPSVHLNLLPSREKSQHWREWCLCPRPCNG